jgi:hypothetical protein
MTHPKSVEEILKELWSLGYNAGLDRITSRNKNCELAQAKQALLKVILEQRPEVKSRGEMLTCLTQTNDSVDVSLAKHTKISEMVGWNQCCEAYDTFLRELFEVNG